MTASQDRDGETAGRLAIVTGAGTGIGRAISVRLGRARYRCLLVGRRLEPLADTAKLLDSEGAADAVVVPADVTTEDGRAAIMAASDEAAVPLHGLVNNAGLSYAAPLFKQELAGWRRDFALNVEAAAFLSFESMRRMADGGGGAIVNIASIYGFVGLNQAFYVDRMPPETDHGPTRAVSYHASKGALRQLSRELAVAGAPMGVRVNTVSPGMIEVDAHELKSHEADRLGRATPMGRVGQPGEIAGAVNFLLSAEASFITGAEIVIDGGWTLW